MRFCKAAVCIYLISSSVAFAYSDDQKNADAINEVTDRTFLIKNSAKSENFQEILKAKEEAQKIADSGRLDWLNGEQTKEIKDALVVERNRKDFFDQAFETAPSKTTTDQQKYPEDALYVFVSLSMPKDALKGLFLEAVASGEKVIFVTRGWKQREFTKTLSRFALLFPKINGKRKMPAMMTDPTLFRSMGIDAVPAFADKKENGGWAVIFGNSDIRSAREYIASGLSLDERLGPVFKVEEPDLIEEIQKAGKNHDWEKNIAEVKKGIFSNQQMVYVPDATSSSSYLVDMSIEVKRDISSPEGTFAFKGDVLNPLDYVSVPHKYVFADVTNPKHVKILRSWKKQYPLMRVMSINMPSDEDERRQLNTEFGYIGIMNKLIVNRFKIKGIPAIAWQEGLMMKITMRNPSE